MVGFHILISHETVITESEMFPFITEYCHQTLTSSVATNWPAFSIHSATKGKVSKKKKKVTSSQIPFHVNLILDRPYWLPKMKRIDF